MLINKDSIMIDSVSMGQYLVESKFGYHKLWGSDTGRVLSGKRKGTLKGIFPKLTLQFRKLTQSELELLAPIFDSAEQTTIYYDPKKKADTTLSTYTGDWEVVNKSIIDINHKNEGFSLAFISNNPRE